jgi:two-component system CheB/CheR fusion protein
VQHLSLTYKSNLTEILSKFTKIPIEEITDEVKIFPNHIYVMPSGKILTSVAVFGRIRLLLWCFREQALMALWD